MSIAPELLSMLRCPQCKGMLRMTDFGSQAALDCPVCRLRFAIRDGIPIMLIEQATRF